MKATLPDGTLFEGTAEEFKIIHPPSVGAANGHGAIKADGGGDPGVWTEKRARLFWDNLDPRHGGGDQKKLLQLLIDKGGRASEVEVRKHLAINKGQELAGVLANLSRNARREAKDDHVKAVVRTYDRGSRVYHIPNDLLKFLKHI